MEVEKLGHEDTSDHEHSGNNAERAADAQADAIAAEAKHSLFLDSINPNFRPPTNLSPTPKVEAPSPSASSPSASSQSAPSQGREDMAGHDKPLSHSLFPERKSYDFLENHPYDSPFTPYAPYNGAQRGFNELHPGDLFRENRQQWVDEQADKIFPGFGRFEGKGLNQDWRLDYLDAKNCRVRSVGLCFMMKMR